MHSMDPIIIDEDEATDDGLDTTTPLINSDSGMEDDDVSTVAMSSFVEEQQEREEFIKGNTPKQGLLYIGSNDTKASSSGSGIASNALVSDEFDELVGTRLKFYQRADTTYPTFRSNLDKKLNFSIPYVEHALEIDEEDSLLTAEVIPHITSELDNRFASIRHLEKPKIRVVEQAESTFTEIEATKLLSLNLGLEKAFKTKCNDIEFEEEFSKIFFSVYGSDARTIFNIVGGIIEADLLKEKSKQ